MPRKPIIQTMVATSLAISGSAEAGTSGSEPLEIGSLDIIGTDFPDDSVFFVGDDIDVLTFDADEDLLFAQEKQRQKRIRETGKTSPTVRDTARIPTRTKPVVKVPQDRARTDTKPDVSRTRPERAVTNPDVGGVACCTVYGGTGNDGIVGGRLGADTIYAGDADDVLRVTPESGVGGTRLRSSGGSSIKLRGQ